MLEIVDQRVLVEKIEKSWKLYDSLFSRGDIEHDVEGNFPNASIRWKSWVSPSFISSPLSSTPSFSGILPALMGSVWLLLLTALVAFPLGVGAAIYLEEYATDTWLNRLIETNIRNLAGVPSIIYGMLGLAIFVRALVPLTSGACFGTLEGYFTLEPLVTGQCFDGNYLQGATGRTIISAAFTLALLILPIIIVNAQEALRAVPSSLREASYGLGATKWQTISRQVLPASIPGIMTGTILAMSRAVGETAPLVVIGAATFITVNPDGPFSRFAALPNVIYYWT
ncbi:MAG: phosphate ABC transporter permease PstA, partial [Anaerolineae bacterium]|nr:phosphate ABC transporter permease PstA [Anaerolineae bacterium]